MVWDSRSSLTSAGCIIRLGLQEQGLGIGDQGSGNAGRLRWIGGGLGSSSEGNFRIAPVILLFLTPRLRGAVELVRAGRILLQCGPGPVHGSGVSPERMPLLERRRLISAFSEGENRLHTFPAHLASRSALPCWELNAAWNGRLRRSLNTADASST